MIRIRPHDDTQAPPTGDDFDHLRARPGQRLLVTGSRDWLYTDPIRRELMAFPDDAFLIVGDCPTGADWYALGIWRDELRRHGQVYRADWSGMARLGLRREAAGPIRNRRMLEEGRPTIALAFRRGGAASRGTSDMIALLRGAGVPTRVIER